MTLSDIPFNGPVAGGRVACVDGQFILNPTAKELVDSTMDMIVACTRNAVVMVEGRADELSEDVVLSAIFHAFEQLQPLIDLQENLQKTHGRPKRQVEPVVVDEALLARVREIAAAGMEKVISTADKMERGNLYSALKASVVSTLDENGERAGEIGDLLSSFKKSFMRAEYRQSGSSHRWQKIRSDPPYQL